MNFRMPCMILSAALCAVAFGQQKPCPMGMDHKDCPLQKGSNAHFKGVNSRGDKAMGFSHEKTHHHFLLSEDGGAIQVLADSAKDSESIGQIRTHLSMIAGMFTDGNFKLPMFIHDTQVPGVETMKKLKGDIIYTYEQVDRGGEVRIQTRNQHAIDAIHNFLRFQIKDHQTGDPLR